MRLLLLMLVGCLGAAGAWAQEARRPNILFLLSDDQRPDTIHALGHAAIATPALDGLAQRGTAFTRAFCMGSTIPAVCSPSRAMMLTGRSLYRAVPADGDSQRAMPELPTWPELLRGVGYRTVGIGKWHNPPALFQRGFVEGPAVFLGGMSKDPFHVPLWKLESSGGASRLVRCEPKVPGQHISETLADAAVDFLQSPAARAQPFALYVSFTSPHDPRDVPPAWAQRYAPAQLPLPANFLPEHPFDNGELQVRDELLLPHPRTPQAVREELARYYAAVTHLDAQVGRILAALQASGEVERTLIIYTSDHGLAVGSHGLLGKQNLYDHSMGAPLLLAGPGVPAGATRANLCYLHDLFPTILEAAGMRVPAGTEGRSLWPLLRSANAPGRDELFLTYRDGQRALRTPEWKLIRYPQSGREQLFHVANDPSERHDLAGLPGQVERLQEMRAALAQAQQEAGDPLLRATK